MQTDRGISHAWTDRSNNMLNMTTARREEREGGKHARGEGGRGIIHIPNTGSIGGRGQWWQMIQKVHEAQSRL